MTVAESPSAAPTTGPSVEVGPGQDGCLTPPICGTSDTPDDLCTVCEERFEAWRDERRRAREADPLCCLSPCPVAHGRAGMLCTCGNAIKRFYRAVEPAPKAAPVVEQNDQSQPEAGRG